MSETAKVSLCPVCGLAYDAPVHFHVTPAAQPAPEGRWRYDPYENSCDFWKAESATPSLNGKEDVALYLDALEAEVAALRHKNELLIQTIEANRAYGWVLADYDAAQKAH